MSTYKIPYEKNKIFEEPRVLFSASTWENLHLSFYNQYWSLTFILHCLEPGDIVWMIPNKTDLGHEVGGAFGRCVVGRIKVFDKPQLDENYGHRIVPKWTAHYPAQPNNGKYMCKIEFDHIYADRFTQEDIDYMPPLTNRGMAYTQQEDFCVNRSAA